MTIEQLRNSLKEGNLTLEEIALAIKELELRLVNLQEEFNACENYLFTNIENL